MHIGGFQKNSLIDFPGTIACVVFTSGCNFICPYCHNPDLAAGPVTGSLYDPDQIFAFLEKRKGMLQGVAITGGEPTLQPDLVEFCQELQKLGYKIKLDTNGTRPSVLSTLFDKNLVDYLAMDIKTSLVNYSRVVPGSFDVTKIQAGIKLIMSRAPAYEFRTTCVRPFITREIMAEIAGMIHGADRYVLQACSRNVPVLEPEFLKQEQNFFSPEELQDLKEIVQGSVKQVSIR